MHFPSVDRCLAPLLLLAMLTPAAPVIAQSPALETPVPPQEAQPREPGLRVPAGPEIALSGARWRVALDLADFTLVREQNQGADNRTMVFLHRDSRIQLTVTLRPAIGRLGPQDYRAARWKRLIALDPPETDETFWERGGVAYLEYGVGSDRHLQAFLQHEGTRIEVHLAVRRSGGADRETVERLIASLAIEERSPLRRWGLPRRSDPASR